MRDFRLTDDGTDLELSEFEFGLVDDIERVSQNLIIRLRSFLGEWYLDRNYGLPYYQHILVKNPDGGLIRSLFKAAIIETADVTALTSFTAELDKVTRRLSISFTCETTFGTISGAV